MYNCIGCVRSCHTSPKWTIALCTNYIWMCASVCRKESHFKLGRIRQVHDLFKTFYNDKNKRLKRKLSSCDNLFKAPNSTLFHTGTALFLIAYTNIQFTHKFQTNCNVCLRCDELVAIGRYVSLGGDLT